MMILYNASSEVVNRIEVLEKVSEKVFIYDNSSKLNKEIKEYVESSKKIVYYSNFENNGISKALNWSFQEAIKISADFILTMDQDTEYTENEINKMKEYISNQSRKDISRVGIFSPNYVKIYTNKNSKPAIKTNEVIEKNWTMTSGSFVNLEAIQNIGMIDENFFLSYVDIDLGTFLRINNYKIILVGQSTQYQQLGDPIKGSLINILLRKTQHNNSRYYYMVRNNFYFRKKYKDNKEIVKMSYYLLSKYIYKIIFSEKDKVNKIKSSYLGYKAYKKNELGKREGL